MLAKTAHSVHPLPHLLCVSLLFCLSLSPALAEPEETRPEIISGIPVVQESGTLVINGKKIALWGISPLAPDQQCWQGETAWCCGEQAITVLRHIVEGRMVECVVQAKPEDGPILAQCYRRRGRHHRKRDIAAQLVRHGWATDQSESSSGAYLAAEEEARYEKRGIWDSRFQTAQDWKDGIQRFVGEEGTGQPAHSLAPEQKDAAPAAEAEVSQDSLEEE